jgi:hypothetical protein
MAEYGGGREISLWRRGIWRTEVELRIAEIRHRLDTVTNGRAKNRLASHGTVPKAINELLGNAEKAAGPPRGRFAGVRSWWSGAAITTAWQSVHEAESKLVQLESDDDVLANLPRVLAWIQRVMDPRPQREHHEKTLTDQIEKKPKKADRLAIRQAFDDVIDANNERYASLRTFRNKLVLVTGILAALIGILAVWHLKNPDFLTLCSGTGTDVTCLDGSEPRGPDVALVALVGAVGGLLATAFGLAKTQIAPSRYDPKAWQALLKPVAGSATALIGVLLIQADILLGSSDSRSEALLLAYAALFGFSQQLLTQFIDKRADKLIGSGDEADESTQTGKAGG